MLKINLTGARVLIDLLQRTKKGESATEIEFEKAIEANAFFINFYSHWEGSDLNTIKETIRRFSQPERLPSGILPKRLADGFRQAVDNIDHIRSQMSWLSDVDPSSIEERVLPFLPAGTPLDSIIHITVDFFNNAFAYQGEIAISLLTGATDRKTFNNAVAHELHHIGYRFWSEKDTIRLNRLSERSGRSVATRHVDNLLSEGMANYYCTPGYVFRESPDSSPVNSYDARLFQLLREEKTLFENAERILTISLDGSTEYDRCWEAFKSIAFDMEEQILPAGHYLGARMVQTMEQVHPRDRVLRCAEHLSEFLPLYNMAASKAGGFVFGEPVVQRFTRLLHQGKTR